MGIRINLYQVIHCDLFISRLKVTEPSQKGHQQNRLVYRHPWGPEIGTSQNLAVRKHQEIPSNSFSLPVAGEPNEWVHHPPPGKFNIKGRTPLFNVLILGINSLKFRGFVVDLNYPYLGCPWKLGSKVRISGSQPQYTPFRSRPLLFTFESSELSALWDLKPKGDLKKPSHLGMGPHRIHETAVYLLTYVTINLGQSCR